MRIHPADPFTAVEAFGVELYCTEEGENSVNVIRILKQSIREYKRASVLAPVMVTGEVILECIIPFVTARLINEIKAGSGLQTILIFGFFLIVMAMLSLFFGVQAGNYSASASTGFAKNLRKDMYYRVQDFSFENIDHFETSSLVTRMTTDVTNVQMAYMMLVRLAFRSPIMLVFSFIMAFIMGGQVAWIFVLVAPILGIGLSLLIWKALPIFNAVFKKYDALNDSVQENIGGMRVVKSFTREDYEKEKFNARAEDLARDFVYAEKLVSVTNPLMQFCLYVVVLFVMSFGSWLVITSCGSRLDVGQLSALLTYSFQILSSLMMLSMVFVMVTISVESAKRIAEVLSEESSMKESAHPVRTIRDGSVDFDHVSFKYSPLAERPVLSDIDLHIRSGEMIGILGGTGSAKSSLTQLISRLYDVTEGSVRVGGVDVRDYDLKLLRDQVAVVLQKNILFSGSIKENLRWGNPNATEEEMKKACELAQASEFIELFPDRYDTHIEQGGSNVSGGQKQRLCIARALLKKPKVLILDDSTSAVDTRTDALIRKGMQEYIPDTTKIIIAQRVSSVQEADRIVILDKGRIAAVGTHEELLEKSPIYREVYESQNRKGEEEDG